MLATVEGYRVTKLCSGQRNAQRLKVTHRAIVEQRVLVAIFNDALSHEEVYHSRSNDLQEVSHVGINETCEWVKDNRIVLQGEDTVEHDGVQVRIESQVRAHSLHHADGSTLAFDVFVATLLRTIRDCARTRAGEVAIKESPNSHNTRPKPRSTE